MQIKGKSNDLNGDSSQEPTHVTRPERRRRRNAVVDVLLDVTNDDIRRLHSIREGRVASHPTQRRRNSLTTVNVPATDGVADNNVSRFSNGNTDIRLRRQSLGNIGRVVNLASDSTVSPVQNASETDEFHANTVTASIPARLLPVVTQEGIPDTRTDNSDATQTEHTAENGETLPAEADENVAPLTNYNFKKRRNAISHENSTMYLMQMVLAKAGKAS